MRTMNWFAVIDQDLRDHPATPGETRTYCLARTSILEPLLPGAIYEFHGGVHGRLKRVLIRDPDFPGVDLLPVVKLELEFIAAARKGSALP